MEMSHGQLKLRDLAAVLTVFLCICGLAIVAFIVECVYYYHGCLTTTNNSNATAQKIVELNGSRLLQWNVISASVFKLDINDKRWRDLIVKVCEHECEEKMCLIFQVDKLICEESQ